MSQLTIVALICHIVAPIQVPLCHKEIVLKEAIPTMPCEMRRSAIAEWKEKSIFRGEEWKIESYDCERGDFVPEDIV